MKGTERVIDDQRPSLASPLSCPKKPIMVIEQDKQMGMRFVQLIRQEMSSQATLATGLQQVHRNVLGEKSTKPAP